MTENVAQFVINQEVSPEIIQDVIITALEGGSNYWYMLDDLDHLEGLVPGASEGMPISEWVARAVTLTDLLVRVNDVEDQEEFLGYLSQESIKNALAMMAHDYSESLNNILNEDYDAGDADILMQLAVMGEVVFG